jgi:hypothetical protein
MAVTLAVLKFRGTGAAKPRARDPGDGVVDKAHGAAPVGDA